MAMIYDGDTTAATTTIHIRGAVVSTTRVVLLLDRFDYEIDRFADEVRSFKSAVQSLKHAISKIPPPPYTSLLKQSLLPAARQIFALRPVIPRLRHAGAHADGARARRTKFLAELRAC